MQLPLGLQAGVVLHLEGANLFLLGRRQQGCNLSAQPLHALNVPLCRDDFIIILNQLLPVLQTCKAFLLIAQSVSS